MARCHASSPAAWAPSTSSGRPVCSFSSSSGSRLPVCHETCDSAISLVRSGRRLTVHATLAEKPRGK